MKHVSTLDLLAKMSSESPEALAKFDRFARSMLLALGNEIGLIPRDFRLFKEEGNWTLQGSDFTVAVARRDTDAQVFATRKFKGVTLRKVSPSAALLQLKDFATLFTSEKKSELIQAFA